MLKISCHRKQRIPQSKPYFRKVKLVRSVLSLIQNRLYSIFMAVLNMLI
nr:MAG TPA: hypothetical protein [Caudoviricetes sp.]